jgi:hypothetical protein
VPRKLAPASAAKLNEQLLRPLGDPVNYSWGESDYSTAIGSQIKAERLACQTEHWDALVRCLIPRAGTYRLAGELEEAGRDIAAAQVLIEQCGMRLYEIDLSLELAWMALARGNAGRAAALLDKARRLQAEHSPTYQRHAGSFRELENRCRVATD